jgi:hypothetical protein
LKPVRIQNTVLNIYTYNTVIQDHFYVFYGQKKILQKNSTFLVTKENAESNWHFNYFETAIRKKQYISLAIISIRLK